MKKFVRDKQPSLFYIFLPSANKKYCIIDACGLYYKSFYDHKLQSKGTLQFAAFLTIVIYNPNIVIYNPTIVIYNPSKG